MKDLPESEFDRRLKEKSESFDFQFEEDAWTLMENKLRRRDRFVLFRNASILLLLLTLAGSGYFLIKEDKPSFTSAGKTTSKKSPINENQATGAVQSEAGPVKSVTAGRQLPADFKNKSSNTTYESGTAKLSVKTFKTAGDSGNPDVLAVNNPDEDLQIVDYITAHTDSTPQGKLTIALAKLAEPAEPATLETPEKTKSPVSFSLTFAAGPDYSSIESLKGRKATLNTGLLLNVGLKKFTLSTGLRYGVKDYNAAAYDYSLANPSRAASISGIDASCNVLEVPLQAYYPVFSNSKGRIELSAGLSSYFMLKEEYLFKYTPQSGYNDYLLKKENANRHFFSVLNLSTIYKFKPSKKHLQMGIEPYIKLPLGGVGEGKVKLKSSGILLNASYDISKKK